MASRKGRFLWLSLKVAGDIIRADSVDVGEAANIVILKRVENMSAPLSITLLLNEYRFEEVIPLVERVLREAAAESPDRLIEVARGIIAWKGFFANASQEVASEAYFRAVYSLLQELAGADSPAAIAAAENLAGILGSIDKIEEAIFLRERVLEHVRGRFQPDDARLLEVRDGLVFLYRRAGQEEKASELYADAGLCEHLAPAERYVRDQGAKLVSCCRPWSANCHIWAYFDALLDCERLIKTLCLDPCVKIHDHRGTHDGSERGLVCVVHHDGVIGRHPSDAGPNVRTIPVP
jgi:hypothetical protein